MKKFSALIFSIILCLGTLLFILARSEILPVFQTKSFLQVFSSSKNDTSNYQTLNYERLVKNAFKQPEYAKKTKLLCKALEQLEKSSQVKPTSTKILLAKADIEAVLLNNRATCLNKTEKELLKSLDYILSLNPFGMQELYQASLISLRLSDPEKAFTYLRRCLETHENFPKENQVFFTKFLTNSKLVGISLPRKLPQLYYWLELLQEKQAKVLKTSETQVRNALNEAITKLKSDWLAGQISGNQVLKIAWNIFGRSVVRDNESSRKLLDLLLSEVLAKSRNESLVPMLRKRAALNRYNHIFSVVKNDYNPESTMLFNWQKYDSSPMIKIDEPQQSIGFYLQGNLKPKLLFLKSGTKHSSFNADGLEIWGSSDNINYIRHSLASKPSSANISGSEVLMINLEGFSAKYIKLHYSGFKYNYYFKNNLQELVQFYG